MTEKVKRARIILEYLLAFLIVSALLIAIAGAIMVKFYGDELQSLVLREINSKIETKIYVEEININAFRKFPSTSIILKNITIWSGPEFSKQDFKTISADTLMHAETIFLRFNIFSLIRKKYSIKQFEARNGTIKILIDLHGQANYLFFKARETEDEKEGIFVLNELKIENFDCLVNNLAKDLYVKGSINDLRLNGNFYKKEFHLKTQSSLKLERLINKGVLYASDQNLSARLNLDVADSLYVITDGNIQIDRIEAESSGNFLINKSGSVTTNIDVHSENLDIKSISDLIPDLASEKLKGIKGQGKMDITAAITGNLSSVSTPYIEVNFTTRDAVLRSDQFPLNIRQLNLVGNYNNGTKKGPLTSTLQIDQISAEIDREVVEGRFKIRNFLNPEFSFNLKGKLHPANWIIGPLDSLIEKADGILIANLSADGKYARNKSGDKSSVSVNMTGTVDLDDIGFRLANNKMEFHDLNGRVNIENNLWEHSISGFYGSSDFRVTGSAMNLIPYLSMQTEPLIVSADFYSERVDLQQIIKSLPSGSGDSSAFQFPDNLKVRVKYNITDFEKDKFVARNLRGLIIYDPPLLVIDSLLMQTMEGNLSGYIAMAQDNSGNIHTNVFSNLNNLNIQEVFYSFNNFGQSEITDKNIRGNISGTSEFNAEFTDNFKIKTPTIINKNEVEIKKGELKDFEPIMALSKYIDVKELEDIHFATLQNTILIKDSRIIIPQMDIKSNALDLSASGIHQFNNQYDYRITLLLSEILYQKARKNEDLLYGSASDISDTRTLFLKIYNDGEETRVEYDRQKAAEKIREDLKQEKNELRQMFNEELGILKNKEGTEETEKIQKKDEPLFRFEFDDNPAESDTALNESGPEKKRIFKRDKK